MSTSVATHRHFDPLLAARFSLKWVLGFGVAGCLFSGTLVYREFFAPGASCPATGATIAGVPVCVFGLVMYAMITTVAAWGLVASGPSRVSA